MGHTDINLVSENVLIPILKEVFDFQHLENLNYEKNNYPGVDLGDYQARVAIQVTSTSNIEKIKDSLKKFFLHEQHKIFDRLIIYILTERQRSYSAKSIENILQDGFSFDIEKDIIDYRDILYRSSFFNVNKAQKLVEILEENFSESPSLETSSDYFVSQSIQEAVHLNLLELSFPDTLYIAELDFLEESTKKKRKKRFVPKRKKVQKALADLGLRFSVDWECYENMLITFHDLSDSDLPLAEVIDLGTVTPIEPDEFYGANENQERVFKSLLRRCLQQKLYRRQVVWQNEVHQFIFAADDNQEIRKERWVGKRESDRTVYEVTKKDDGKVWYRKHFAFQVQFLVFNEQWYLLIKPEWFFSYDGYKPSFYSADKVDWLKKQEKNIHVYNHLRFIAHFLAHEEPSTLFKQVEPYPFLFIGNLVSFSSSPELKDTEWKPSKTNTNDKNDQDQLDFFDL